MFKNLRGCLWQSKARNVSIHAYIKMLGLFYRRLLVSIQARHLCCLFKEGLKL